MRKTSIPNKLNHKLQAHTMMCEENYNQLLVTIFCSERIDFGRYCGITVTLPINTTRIVHK